MKRTPEQKLLDPRPGSKAAAAAEFGIDLTLTVSQLKKTPQQRIDDLQSAMRSIDALQRSARRGEAKPSHR